MKKISKITLGTAQLGFNYGIANIIGKPSYESSIKILKYAWDNGINTFDTAATYGNSEEIIGDFISSNFTQNNEIPTIISKLPPIKAKKLNFDNFYKTIKIQISQSLTHLKIKKIPIYLLHNASDINLKEGLVVECLSQLKNEGLIDNFGISAYYPNEVKQSLEFKEINSIQIPINLFDHRFIENGLLKRLINKNYFIFARSIYLQGLFLISPEDLPSNLESAKIFLIKLRELSKKNKISIAKLAFLFVRDIPEITSIVIGSERIEQIAENVRFLKEKALSKELFYTIIESFKDIPENIINPSFWMK